MKKTVIVNLLSILLAFGMMFIGCKNGPIVEDYSGSIGINAVGGKIYFNSFDKIDFSVTDKIDGIGNYTKSTVANGTYTFNQKFTYVEIETGKYIWNESENTITIKPEKIAFSDGAVVGQSMDYIEIDGNYGPLQNKVAFTSKVQSYLNDYKAEVGEEEFDQDLLNMGFSDLIEYRDYLVKESFENKKYFYSFSADGISLFLKLALPQNIGINEFSGQTYYGTKWDGDNEVKDETEFYIFTLSGYTFTSPSWETETGSYAYDSNQKFIWLSRETMDGKGRSTYYNEIIVPVNHNYVDDNAYRAKIINGYFRVRNDHYNSLNKTIEWYK